MLALCPGDGGGGPGDALTPQPWPVLARVPGVDSRKQRASLPCAGSLPAAAQVLLAGSAAPPPAPVLHKSSVLCELAVGRGCSQASSSPSSLPALAEARLDAVRLPKPWRKVAQRAVEPKPACPTLSCCWVQVAVAAEAAGAGVTASRACQSLWVAHRARRPPSTEATRLSCTQAPWPIRPVALLQHKRALE